MQLNMKLSIGFTNEKTFIELLTPNVSQLMFRSSVVTDAMLQTIGERCKYLQELRIFDSKHNEKKLNISSDGLVNCIQQLQSLKALQIVDSDKVNDETIKTISQNCPNLQSLWLNDCKNVTDDSSVSLKSMRLNDLNLANTSVIIHIFICWAAKWSQALINSVFRSQMNGCSGWLTALWWRLYETFAWKIATFPMKDWRIWTGNDWKTSISLACRFVVGFLFWFVPDSHLIPI